MVFSCWTIILVSPGSFEMHRLRPNPIYWIRNSVGGTQQWFHKPPQLILMHEKFENYLLGEDGPDAIYLKEEGAAPEGCACSPSWSTHTAATSNACCYYSLLKGAITSCPFPAPTQLYPHIYSTNQLVIWCNICRSEDIQLYQLIIQFYPKIPPRDRLECPHFIDGGNLGCQWPFN